MKRKLGPGRAREPLAEQRMRERAAQMKDNSKNYGTKANKGSPVRGKRRGRAFKPSYMR
jgi:hypothetical protein